MVFQPPAPQTRIDNGRAIDWGNAADDYATWRPDYPDTFYARLSAFGIGQPGQRILDLGTGVGYLARRFAAQGAQVEAVDVAAGSIARAQRDAASEGLDVVWRVAPAEATGAPSGCFDVVTAAQCWVYFDAPSALAEARRVLKPGGLLAVTYACWMPTLDPVVRATEELIQTHNPDWSAGGWSGAVSPLPEWLPEDARQIAHMVYDEPWPFTQEAWRGRIRASRGIGATLDPDAVARFDAEHVELLARVAPDPLTILHRVIVYIVQLDPA